METMRLWLHVPRIISLHLWINMDKREGRVCISAKVNNSPKLNPIPINLEFVSNLLCYHLEGSGSPQQLGVALC